MKGVVIDPGGELDLIVMTAEAEGVVLESILVTHGHHDHCGNAWALAQELKLPIIGPHSADLFWIDRLDDRQNSRGLYPIRSFHADRWLENGDQITVGERTLLAVHCPGHRPGHIVYVDLDERLAFTGDVLFKGTIGTTQLPRGDHLALLRSILGKLWPLGDDIRFIPGHGPSSTFGDERQSNPYVCDQVMAPYLDALFKAN